MVKDINEIIDSFKKQDQGAPEVDAIAGIRRLPSPKDIEKAVKWYECNRSLYEELANEVEKIIKSNLKAEKIVVHDIGSRAKTVESYRKKIESGKYHDPINQIKDYAGIRVICFVPQDVDKICEIVKNIFFIDNANSLDKSKFLKVDQVGYRSIHYIAKYDYDRILLPENKKFIDLFFEIQIRTILQHSWAEFEHDRNYKFSEVLPVEIKRRFYLLAGTLELVDREFDSLAKDIKDYEDLVKNKIEANNFETEINSASLRAFLKFKFAKLKNQIEYFDFNKDIDNETIEELNIFGLKTIQQLNEIIPNNFVEVCIEIDYSTTIIGVLRDIMIISDWNKYFEKCWRENWKTDDIKQFSLLLEKYDISVEKLLEKYDFFVINDYESFEIADNG